MVDAGEVRRRSGLIKTLGPGIIYAGAAIGVSHLVQSTRAGAGYGFALLGIILLVNLFKYPFFEFGHRYSAATGESMLTGYRRVGRWALGIFLLVSFGSGMPTLAAVTLVAAGLATHLFPGGLTALEWSAILVAFSLLLMAVGGYPWLDGLMKLMMVFLVISTVVAVVAACFHKFEHAPDFTPPTVWNRTGVMFVIALMGWMPTPVDISAWPSLWMRERRIQTGHQPTLGEALFDFNLGYGATTVMAVLFLCLGALVMFGSGVTFASAAPAFAGQLISMYTTALGGWSRPFILTAAFTCMLSTTITVLDGYPRVIAAGVCEWGLITGRNEKKWYWVLNLLMCGGALAIIAWLPQRSMLALVGFITTVAFLSAPLLAWLNHLTLKKAGLPPEAAPPAWLWWLSRAGIVFLLGFSCLYIWSQVKGG